MGTGALKTAGPAAALTALGIVYGDLGTSPLYTLQTIAEAVGHSLSPRAALGILSLIFWALITIISLKYCIVVMRADNHGEGGILALMSLIGAKWSRRGGWLVAMGLFGAALIYGDGVITPAISVLSALEGLDIATDVFKPHLVPLAVAILFGLFAVQSRGTERIGRLFGPVMLVWFFVIALLGITGIVRAPSVLRAVDPRFAADFLWYSGWKGLVVLGGVFLAVTGGEALYADIGHVGRGPIRFIWYGLVLPSLLLSYAGQTALLVTGTDGGHNPFFALAPAWAIYPLVALATAATIIASQAIITGAFSLTRQAMQLGWFPSLHIRQTSDIAYGQIYVPAINWAMMLCTVWLTVSFRSSVRLAGAYGTAVSTTMLLTTVLLYRVMRERWQWTKVSSLLVISAFLTVDTVFFAANLLKIVDGGWIPLTVGALLFIVMTTWHWGIEAMRARLHTMTQSPEQFFARLTRNHVPRVPGTALFLTRARGGIPSLMVEHVAQFGALQETVMEVTVDFHHVPRIPSGDRLEIIQLENDFWHITVNFGFIEVPDVPAALLQAQEIVSVDFANATYFGARDDVVPAKDTNYMGYMRRHLFAFLFRNSVRNASLFNLPAHRFLELGRQIEI